MEDQPITTQQPITNVDFVSPPIPTSTKPSLLLPIILSSLITSIVLVGGYYLFLSKNPQSVSTPSPSVTTTTNSTVDPTSDWQTYTSKDLGFEIKYPTHVKIDKEMNDQYNKAVIFKGDNLNFQVMLREIGDIMLEKYYFMDNADFSKTFLDKKDANRYIYEASTNSCVSDGSGPGCPTSYVVYVAQKGAYLYHVGFYETSKLSDIEEQILTSFKFTN